MQPSVLIVGGGGFVGYHLVRSFISPSSSFTAVAVLSRSAANAHTTMRHVDGATYHAGDLSNHAQIRELVDQIRPTVIIHAASPSPITGAPKEYQRVTIQGTRNILNVAKESPYVRAFIYTSSSTLHKGSEHLNLTEEYPLAHFDHAAPSYAKAKARAELLVLDANDPISVPLGGDEGAWQGHLATGSLRFPIIYGTHDPVTIPGCLRALQQGQTNAQLGDGKNLWDFCSVDNCVVSHALLARSLLSGSLNGNDKVDGEAFHINDGEPHPFWNFAHTVWKFAGYSPTKPEKLFIIPAWVAMGLASLLEWAFWLFTLNTRRPQLMGKQQVEYACFTHTYSIEKAKSRLGFQPRQDFESGLKEAVEWSLENDGWGEKLKKLKKTAKE